jgi:hypothetical protein
MSAVGYRVITSALGSLHQHVCHGCGATFATYPNSFPRKWKRVDGRPWCSSCCRYAQQQSEARRASGRLQ